MQEVVGCKSFGPLDVADAAVGGFQPQIRPLRMTGSSGGLLSGPQVGGVGIAHKIAFVCNSCDGDDDVNLSSGAASSTFRCWTD